MIGCDFIISYNQAIVKSKNEIFANHLQIFSYYIHNGILEGDSMRVRVSGFFWVGLAAAAVAGAGSIFRSGLTAGAVWTEIRPWLAILAAAGMHELGHMIAAWGAGARIRGFCLDLFGARLELAGLLSYGRELGIAAGGPIISLVCAALAYPLAATRGGEALGLFCGASLAFGIFNLLPIPPLDGSKILFSVLPDCGRNRPCMGQQGG